MRHWKLEEIDLPEGSRSPAVLHSEDGDSRVVLIELQPGQELGEHQVTEAALLLVVKGRLRVDAGDESVEAGPGELFRFEPKERRSVTSPSGARLLLTFSPWPGKGHYRGDETTSGAAAA